MNDTGLERGDLDPGRLDSCRRRADASGDGAPDLAICICLETGKERACFQRDSICFPISVGAGVSSGEISDRLPLRPDLSPAPTYILLRSNLFPLSKSPLSRPLPPPVPHSDPPARPRWPSPIPPARCPSDTLPVRRSGISASTTPTTRTPSRHPHILPPIPLISTAMDLPPPTHMQDRREAPPSLHRSSRPPPSRQRRTARSE